MSPRIKKATKVWAGWKPSPRKSSRKGAVLSVELVMVLPILLFVLLAFVEFGLMLMSQQGLAAASSLGARHAALTWSTEASVSFKRRLRGVYCGKRSCRRFASSS